MSQCCAFDMLSEDPEFRCTEENAPLVLGMCPRHQDAGDYDSPDSLREVIRRLVKKRHFLEDQRDDYITGACIGSWILHKCVSLDEVDRLMDEAKIDPDFRAARHSRIADARKAFAEAFVT